MNHFFERSFMNKRDVIAEKVIKLLLEGHKVSRVEINELGDDANYVIDLIRNKRLIPVECDKGRVGVEPYWFMSKSDIALYMSDRKKQMAQQKIYITVEQRKRQLKSAERLLKSMDIPISPKLQDIIDKVFSSSWR